MKIKTNAIIFSIEIDEEVFRKSKLNEIIKTMNKQERYIGLSEETFYRIFNYKLNDLEVEDIRGINSTWSIKFPIEMYKPIFRYYKNRIKYLKINNKKRFFIKHLIM